MVTGLIIGWLWLRTESIWLVAIAHGALNNWGQYAFKYMKDSVTPDAVSSDLAVFGAGVWLSRCRSVSVLARHPVAACRFEGPS
jgi:membrane protease YdiL (CAAX protease family)